MSHLKCTSHERRVMVIGNKVLHRSTVASEITADCDTPTVIIGAAVYPRTLETFTSKDFPEVDEAVKPKRKVTKK